MGSSGQKHFCTVAQVPGELSITSGRSGHRAQKGHKQGTVPWMRGGEGHGGKAEESVVILSASRVTGQGGGRGEGRGDLLCPWHLPSAGSRSVHLP